LKLWAKKIPHLSHLRTFGAEAYVFTPDILRKKLDPKSKKMILVGYDGNSTNYRLYDPDTKKITISRNVIFNEEKLGSISPVHYAPISVDDDNEEKSPNSYMDNKEEIVHLENITDSTLKEKSSKSIEQKENTRELRPRDKLKPLKRYYAMYTEEKIPRATMKSKIIRIEINGYLQ